MKPSTALLTLVTILCATSFVLGMLYQRGQSVMEIQIQPMPSPTPKSNIGTVQTIPIRGEGITFTPFFKPTNK